MSLNPKCNDENLRGAMQVNGLAAEKETSEQRFVRYVADLRKRYEMATREQWSGELTLTLCLAGGTLTRRSISFEETAK
jgi:hypothetical protein